MKKLKLFIIFLFLIFAGINVSGQMVRIEETSKIAHNWIQIIIDKFGHWGKYDSAVDLPVHELRKNNRMIGYYCHVAPKGYIVISLRKELATVKAFSETYEIDFSQEQGMAGLIKDGMSSILNAIESKLGLIDTISVVKLAGLFETDPRKSWDYIENYIPGSIQKNSVKFDNYNEGDTLLKSSWHQFPPYNNECPYGACPNTTNGNAIVGCVATAGSQIMRYWGWPPYGVGSIFADPYDWSNMPDWATTLSPPVQQSAVAELCHEVGEASDADYGCDATYGDPDGMGSAYKNTFRFDHSITRIARNNYTAAQWDEFIKENINMNRPIQYDITEHSIVCDGWQITAVEKLYHMNFGWGDNNSTTWYNLDNPLLGNFDDQDMIMNIFPVNSLGSSFGGVYPAQSFPYRYFDQDASGGWALFGDGQMLQTLPGIVIKGIGTNTNVEFFGGSSTKTHLYTNGDPSNGIVLMGGHINLRNNGSIKLSKP